MLKLTKKNQVLLILSKVDACRLGSLVTYLTGQVPKGSGSDRVTAQDCLAVASESGAAMSAASSSAVDATSTEDNGDTDEVMVAMDDESSAEKTSM